MSRYFNAEEFLNAFDAGHNPVPEAASGATLLARHYGDHLDCLRLERYFKLYGIQIDRLELRRFKDGADFVYVLDWPGALTELHWAQRLTPSPEQRG
jgi:hypothetical protein